MDYLVTAQKMPGFLLALTIPLVASIIWEVFAVPNDPSRLGKATVRVNGALRLAIELIIFVLAVWMVFNPGYSLFAGLFGVAVVTQYLLSMNRISWLIQQKKDE